jgi:hypothetical protein
VSSEPSDEDLMAFAATLLRGSRKAIDDAGVLRETVREARELWVLLYREAAAHDAPPDGEGPPAR